MNLLSILFLLPLTHGGAAPNPASNVMLNISVICLILSVLIPMLAGLYGYCARRNVDDAVMNSFPASIGLLGIALILCLAAVLIA